MSFAFLKQKLFQSRQGKRVSAGDKVHASGNSTQPLLSSIGGENVEVTLFGVANSLEAQPPLYGTLPNVSSDETASQGSSRSKVDPRIVSDAILGLSDGLTVPFALSAGLSALGETKLVVLGGLAELAAGAISMGLGGYVGAKSEEESYNTTVREVDELVKQRPGEAHAIVRKTFKSYGLSETIISEICASLRGSPNRLRDFLIAFHHKQSKQPGNRAYISAITLALGYFIGGFIPLIPYFCISQIIVAFYASAGVMAITLLVFGYAKTGIVRGWRGRDNIVAGLKNGVQMCLVGGIAAGAAIGLVRMIDAESH